MESILNFLSNYWLEILMALFIYGCIWSQHKIDKETFGEEMTTSNFLNADEHPTNADIDTLIRIINKQMFALRGADMVNKGIILVAFLILAF
jgi:hypothetical protein